MNQSKTMYPAPIKNLSPKLQPLFFWSLYPKTFHLHIMPPTSVILREAKGEVAESTDMNELKPSRRGWTVNKDR